MTKAKTNALDTLRALIAERQQYDQWISTLESKRDGTPEHVFNRVHADYQSRLDRVLGDIRSHSEELQLSIGALSSRLQEVGRDEAAKRDAIQEAELRAAVGEYDSTQWETMRADAGRQLEKIAADRAALEGQLAELESIRKLSEVTTAPAAAPQPPQTASATPAPAPAAPAPPPAVRAAPSPPLPPQQEAAPAPKPEPVREEVAQPRKFSEAGWPARDIVDIEDLELKKTPPKEIESAAGMRATPDKAASVPRPTATPQSPTPATNAKRRTPSGKDAQIASGFTKPVPTPPEGRPEVNKTLKCPECGTPNYPTEWYCERCGGELATM
jgi:hypothetical protein